MYDVAIIGCGPVGALAANLLGTAGVRTIVIEQSLDPHPLPRAVHLDHEMMRLFQSAGVIDRVAGDMRDTEGHLHIGADGGVIRYMGTVGRPRPFGWSNDYFFYQPELEQHLRDALGACPHVTLRRGVTLSDLDQSADGVVLQVETLGGSERIEARFVIACDGARSSVRKLLGIELEDLDFEEPWLVIDAEVDAPVHFPPLHGVPPEADLQKLSVMMCDPARPTTIVPGRGKMRRWEMMLLPGEDDAEMMAPETVAALLAPYLDGVPHRIVRATTYRFHGLVATRWQEGRVFLAGDAAHQTPPFFGQGMCHGLRDVANLAWKLGLVLSGGAPRSLLETYQPERDPHVRAVIEAAVAAGRYICMLDPAEAAVRDETMRARARSAGTATAADLIPAIRDGVIASGTPGAGERFIQPRLGSAGSGALLDDAIGGGWRLFVRDAGARPSRGPGDVTIVDAGTLGDGGQVAAWLAARAVDAVLVRPDHYVFGSGRADELLMMIDAALGIREPVSAAA